MTKSKILIKAATAKAASSSDGSEAAPPARPRTAGGDRGLLRRFRFGRMLFGAGHDSDSSAGRRGTAHIFRTNSVQAPAPDTLHMSMPPPPALPTGAYGNGLGAQTVSPRTRPAMPVHADNNADARMSRYSVMSRRSSAPDVAEMARRISRHVEDGYPAAPLISGLGPSSTRHNPPTGPDEAPGYACSDANVSGAAEVSGQQPGADDRRHEDSKLSLQPNDRGRVGGSSSSSSSSAAATPADVWDDMPFIPLSSAARGRTGPGGIGPSSSHTERTGTRNAAATASTAAAATEAGHWGAASALGDVFSAAHAGPSAPDMPRATMVWREQPEPPPRSRSLSTESAPSSPELMPLAWTDNCSARSTAGSENQHEGAVEAIVPAFLRKPTKDSGSTTSTHRSHESRATIPSPPPSRSPLQCTPAVAPPASPLRQPPTAALPATPLTARPGSGKAADDSCCPAATRRTDAGEPGGWSGGPPPLQARPKSLYGRPSYRSLPAEGQADSAEPAAARPSPSIASAKAFLMMIASSPHGRASAAGRGHLSIDTSGVSGKDPGLYSSGDSPTTLAPVSAPVAGSAAPHVFEHQRPQRFVDEAPAKGGDDERTTRSQDTADLDEKSSPLLTSPGAMGSRSFRARSKLAGVGIRRASTYVWGRSSVFIRALSSTDELPGNGALAPSQQPLPQPLPPQPAPGAWESDMDTGSTKTEDTSSHSGPAVPAAAAAAAASAPAQQESTASPASQPAASARRFAKSPAAMRLHAARELVMTEKNFVDNLFVIKKVWMEPVFSSANSLKPIIPYQTARIVFFGIAALHAHASHFYREMDFTLGSYERGSGPVEGWADDGMRIGALFRGSSRHWSDFIAYVRNYGAAVNCLKHLEDYKPYQRYHEECMLQKRTNRQSLKDLLMLPIQRITRYTLLLKNILKHTPAVHSDHIDICRAVKNVTHFATIVNECRRKQEEVQRTIEVLRSIDVCPPFPHIETRAFVAEFYVRELISRLPTRLLLFSDMLVVAQGPAQAITSGSSSGAGAGSSIDVDVEWTYYGSASLDEVEVQNADESTSTLITILSLNRNAASADTLGSSRRSLLPGTEPPTNTSSTSDLRGLAHPGSQGCGSDAGELGDSRARSSGGPQGSGPYMPATQSLADVSSADPVGRKKKSKSRRGLLHSGSRESIPDHIAALSHSTFPSPVPPPTHLDHSQSRLCGTASDRESHTPQPQPQRPKTAAGSHSGVPSITHAHSALALHNSSNSTIGSHGGSLHPIDLATPLPGSASSVSAGRADIASPKPIQLTLVMQHATSAARKQFVRALKDATAIFINEALGFGDSDVASSHRLEDSSSEVLNLHPL